jgi:hypothetical protein
MFGRKSNGSQIIRSARLIFVYKLLSLNTRDMWKERPFLRSSRAHCHGAKFWCGFTIFGVLHHLQINIIIKLRSK